MGKKKAAKKKARKPARSRPPAPKEQTGVRVKLLTGRAGSNFSQRPGDVITVPKDEARRLIESKQAVPAPDAGAENATTAATESR